jgi:gamma-glutamyltranspeptidase/glutathione hydrolase
VKDDANILGYKSIPIPRLVRGMDVIHRRYGSLPWKTLLQPAIRLARDGFRVYPYIVKMGFNEEGLPKLSANEACAKIYTNNGRPWKVGELVVNKDYARTLEKVANEGADVFYFGEIAERMIEDLEAHGGFVTMEDLHVEKPIEYEPFSTDYRGYTILGDRPPGRGSWLIEIFNILEGVDLRGMGWNTPEYLNMVARAMLIAWEDRMKYSFDPNLVPGVWENFRKITSKEYAAEMREMLLDYDFKIPNLWESHVKKDETSAHVIYDDEGNAINLIHTIDSSAGIVTPGLGFMYSGHMMSFDPRPGFPDSVAPRKTPRTGGLGTMVLKDEKPHIVLSTPGGRGSAEVQAILDVIEFGMNPQLALSSPRINIYKARKVCVESNFPRPYPVNGLEELLGMKCTVDDYTGRLSCIVIDPETGKIEAGADPRGSGGLALLP